MNELIQEIIYQMPNFILLLFRISSFMINAPIFSYKLIPGRVRLILSLLLTLLLLPTLPAFGANDLLSIQGVFLIATQIIIGLLIGFSFKIVFEIFLLAGQMISFQMGLGFATLINPGSGLTVPILSQIYFIAMFLVFLSLNGHLALLTILFNSLQYFPLDQSGLLTNNIKAMLEFSVVLFRDSLSLALPAIFAILIVNVTFGILTSTAPQLNIFNIGFPITLVFGLLIIFVTFSTTVDQSADIFNYGFEHLKAMMSKGV